nr:translocation/assembly module TamB [Membranihabitans marinus]
MVDSEGNLADVSGGIRHDHLTNFRMDTRVSSDKFLLLNTQNTEGALFYGRGLGKASLHISGPFTQLNMDVQARTGPTSHISIPISSTISVDRNEDFFINFISNNTFEEYDNIKVDNGRFKIEGLKLNLDLTLTEDCEVSIILDESSGDILRSRGFSELHMEMSRSGNFTMQGTYEVISGQYLFAQLNFTRKSFKINRGGTITWNGDPLDAKIDLDASYSVRTPPYNFIIEYLNVSDDRLQELAQNATPVDLFLHLSGDLFSPEINFNIEFPELSGQIKNYVEDRMRVLKDDQNEINKQVFGLLIARSFIPSVSSVVNIDGTVVNTVSEVLTNQLSFFITEYLQSSLDDVAFISDIELNVGYNVYRNSYERDVNTGVKTGNEIILQPEFGFLDNRLRIRTEANLLTGSAFNANTLITHDFVIEYAITEDHRLKANLYQRTEPYRTEKNAKFGVGLSYRKEFDSFYNFIFGSRSKSEL